MDAYATAFIRLILRSIAKRCVSKDGAAAWFETRCYAALLTMRPREASAYLFFHSGLRFSMKAFMPSF